MRELASRRRSPWTDSAVPAQPFSSLGLVFVSLFIASLFLLSCGGAKPYRLIAEAVRSPERPMVFVHDKKLRLRLREALVLGVPDSTLSVSPYVVGGHAFLVGWVKDDAQRMALEEAARGISGLLSVAGYLPLKPTGSEAPDSSSELGLKAKVVGAIVAASGTEKINISVEVLGTHAILVGALRSRGDIQSASQAASDMSGISGVTNFLSVPLDSNTKRFGGILP